MKCWRHSAEDRPVNIFRTIRRTHDHDRGLTLRSGLESVPQLHELGLDHGRGLVVVRVSGPEEGVDLVDEDDARSDLRRQGEHGSGEFLWFSVPWVEKEIA